MSDLDAQWEAYKQKFGKVYDPEEDKVRRAIWEESLKRVEAHNKEADEGKHTWWMGINQFSDKKPEEPLPCGLIQPPFVEEWNTMQSHK
ncbi:protein CTLA-2-alpha-like [Boleophthalmus pectinirostris]|uniref:protein CTLA-2-alpha-like n=1 Tax=Boleophthalmus pectinirostris TaxID=150288 RepID=UPI00242A943B|nr:protein CTLA-2-alpha-like [Boleophthalmus pectinirostris]